MLRAVPARGRVFAAAALLALASLALAAPAAYAGAVPSCGFAAGVVTVSLPTDSEAMLFVDAGSGAISLFDGLTTTDCGGTNVDTDTVNVTGSTGAEVIAVNATFGAFGPGLTAEADDDEVEVNIDLEGGASDEVQYEGTSLADTVSTNATGVKTNTDSDVDITVADSEHLSLFGNGDDDTITTSLAPTGVTQTWLVGDAGDDTITAGSLTDLVDGADGDDVLNGGSGNDSVRGGDGLDTTNGGSGTDLLIASYGGDSGVDPTQGMRVDFTKNPITNDGWGNADSQPLGFEGATGTAFNDTLKGTSKVESFTGGDGNDTINGQGGNDTLTGGNGNDTLNGSYGNDTINGGADDDTILAGDGDDTVTAGTGTDVIDFSATTNKVIVNLTAGTADGQGTDTLSGFENAIGTNYADTIRGTGTANVLTGKAGNDSLIGLAGSDTLTGGDGRDSLNGGDGEDTCAGGPGSPDTGTSCETETGIP